MSPRIHGPSPYFWCSVVGGFFHRDHRLTRWTTTTEGLGDLEDCGYDRCGWAQVMESQTYDTEECPTIQQMWEGMDRLIKDLFERQELVPRCMRIYDFATLLYQPHYPTEEEDAAAALARQTDVSQQTSLDDQPSALANEMKRPPRKRKADEMLEIDAVDEVEEGSSKSDSDDDEDLRGLKHQSEELRQRSRKVQSQADELDVIYKNKKAAKNGRRSMQLSC